MNSNVQERRSLVDLVLGTTVGRLALALAVVVSGAVMLSGSVGPGG